MCAGVRGYSPPVKDLVHPFGEPHEGPSSPFLSLLRSLWCTSHSPRFCRWLIKMLNRPGHPVLTPWCTLVTGPQLTSLGLLLRQFSVHLTHCLLIHSLLHQLPYKGFYGVKSLESRQTISTVLPCSAKPVISSEIIKQFPLDYT